MNGAEIFSAPLFNIIRKKHPKLYGRFYGGFYRSTMNLKNKISLLDTFLARGNIDDINTLIETFKKNYNVEEIPRRNKDLMRFYSL